MKSVPIHTLISKCSGWLKHTKTIKYRIHVHLSELTPDVAIVWLCADVEWEQKEDNNIVCLKHPTTTFLKQYGVPE